MANQIVRCPACGSANRVPPHGAGSPSCGKCHTPLPWFAEADDDTFAEVVEQSGVPAIVDFWAAWCGPCRMVSPALERVAQDLSGAVKLVKVDVDTAQQLSQRFAIQAVPTLMIVKDGEVVARRAGAAPADQLRGWVEENLGLARDERSRP
ncbi:thioredoxin [Natronosporangium hydrolyticum]|uniref:Thioredoxin n=1 Tax=Natronosporangium hydrolyticum TaxID=2811111 RepID=A0A895YFT2_9ACTN|nr:thioredoxin [Natronosporangium hydrolyticum]QSB16677.1 thioredoxin [Natronosporangium hydrolyticum]